MPNNENWEKEIDDELYFLSQDGYAAGWREMKKDDIKEEVRREMLEKARKTDYADRTEYDECVEILDQVFALKTLSNDHE